MVGRWDFDCSFCILAGDACEFADLLDMEFIDFVFVFVFGRHEAGGKGKAGQALQNDGVVVSVGPDSQAINQSQSNANHRTDQR